MSPITYFSKHGCIGEGRMSHRANYLMVLVAIMGLLEGINAQPQRSGAGESPAKRVLPVPLFFTVAPFPSDLDEMVLQSDAVVSARYTGEKRFIHNTAPDDLPSTVFTLRIRETLKTDVRIDIERRMDISLPGGDVDLGNEILRYVPQGVVPLEMGHVYVIFLTVNPNTDALTTIFARIFDVTGASVAPMDAGAGRHAGRDVPAFIAQIRSTARRQWDEQHR